MIEISFSNHLLILHPKFMEKRWNGKIIQNDISGCCCFLFEINIENSLQVVKFLNFWIANFKMAKKNFADKENWFNYKFRPESSKLN